MKKIDKLIEVLFSNTIKDILEESKKISVNDNFLIKYQGFEFGCYILYETYAILMRCEGPLYSRNADSLLDIILGDFSKILIYYGVIGCDTKGATDDIIRKRIQEYHHIMHLSKDYQSNLFCLNNLEYICNKDLELQTIQPSISARLRQVSKIYDKFDINGESQLKEKYSSSSQFNKNHSLYVKYMEPIKAYYINKRNFQEKLGKIFKYFILIQIWGYGLVLIGVVVSLFFK